MNITTPVERQAKGAVPICIPRAIFRPSIRQTNGRYDTGSVSHPRAHLAGRYRSRYRAGVSYQRKIGEIIVWEILDDPHPYVCGDRARGRRDLDGSRIRRLRVRAEDKTESLARRQPRVRIKAVGEELHIRHPLTAHSSLRSQLNGRQWGDPPTGPFIADLDAWLIPGA